jgi:hypothetical protein
MHTIEFHKTTRATPEQLLAAIVDFGPGRGKVFPLSSDNYLKVHDRGSNHADVTEGNPKIWERLHYDWSEPNRVVMTTTDSNVWGNRSRQTYSFTRRPDGLTDLDVVVERDGKNLKGRLLEYVVHTVGRRVLDHGLDKTIEAVEARN